MDRNYIFVSARTDSSRLSRKALLPIAELVMIEYLVNRLLLVFPPDKIVVCTTDSNSDNELADKLHGSGINVFRGQIKDVMGRFLSAALKYGAKNIARVTGDNPFTDPWAIELMFKSHEQLNADYTHAVGMPVGSKSEIISIKSLRNIYDLINDRDSSEYMTYMLNRPDVHKVNCVLPYPVLKDLQEYYITVDTQFDYEKIILLEEHGLRNANTIEILNFIESDSELKSIFSQKPIVLQQKFDTSFKYDSK